MRWLGVGLASCIAVVTLGLWATGRIGLYINPDASWWAVSMALVLLAGAIASCAVPVRDGEHDHDPVVEGAKRDEAHRREPDDPGEAGPSARRADSAPSGRAAAGRRSQLAIAATAIGGALASVFVILALVLPPASLSAELALSRSSGVPPQLAGSATLALATSGDTSSFGIGEWASVIATTTDPASFVGEPAMLTGFVAPGPAEDAFELTRLVIVHCVIDAQAASVPVAEAGWSDGLEVGQWVEVQGVFALDGAGALILEPTAITPVSEPGDPYEF